MKRDILEKGDVVTWASYHASNQNVSDNPHLALTQLMPLFNEKAATAAMVKHGMVVQHQGGVWTTSELTKQERPSPEGWGWSWDNEVLSWTPVWTTLPLASKACTELIKCGYKSKNDCGARCGCKKVNWSSTNSVVATV